MQGKWIERIFMGNQSDSERALPKRPKEVEDEEEKAHDEFFNSLTDEQKQKYVRYSFKEGEYAAFESDIMYRRGFRLGARLMLEILLEDE